MKQHIFVTFRVPGFHRWPEAPPACAYLADRHRHEFHVRVDVEVSHEHRQVEFILFKGVCRDAFISMGEGLMYNAGVEYGSRSCEHLAADLYNILKRTYPNIRAIEVSEDGENGARVEF